MSASAGPVCLRENAAPQITHLPRRRPRTSGAYQREPLAAVSPTAAVPRRPRVAGKATALPQPSAAARLPFPRAHLHVN